MRALVLALMLPLAAQAEGMPTIPADIAAKFDGKPQLLTEWLTAIMHSTARQVGRFDSTSLDLSRLQTQIDIASVAQRAKGVGDFMAYDLNWDGTVTRQEVIDSYGAADPDLDWTFKPYDLNSDGAVPLAELHAALGREAVDPSHFIEPIVLEMRGWDLDADGQVTAEEIAQIVAAQP
ncbi:EF-hand domain-containing protein [Tropicibacter naphthalenivorans]|uniref:EF-hand domain-containing protein n=1 Tax=Tropicibacter naphthalenivorans TaxID=441103 RepID=A0A0P1GSB5_9RHOB|nr:EF-hand domain-containing protein [Tropicibacter naphthalenivorans]CUH78564.1 hypothetical protein TRN7648_02040 [Tropicibacter naphthalenivorans]SMC80929.1 hypothetical protein SAMN04488093_104202 [Tropicibacter naphthalenivorans]